MNAHIALPNTRVKCINGLYSDRAGDMKCRTLTLPPQCEDKNAISVSQEIWKTTQMAYENIKDKCNDEHNACRSPVAMPSQPIAMQQSLIAMQNETIWIHMIQIGMEMFSACLSYA